MPDYYSPVFMPLASVIFVSISQFHNYIIHGEEMQVNNYFKPNMKNISHELRGAGREMSPLRGKSSQKSKNRRGATQNFAKLS